jgi:hypothetical protein
VKTGAIYEPENVNIWSPSKKWKSADAGATETWTWERDQTGGVDNDYVFDAVAVFRTNMARHITINGYNFGGGGSTTLYDGTQTSGRFTAACDGAPENNVITAKSAGGRPAVNMIPNQFASSDMRDWYLIFTSGGATDEVFKILANTETEFIVDNPVSAANNDNFTIYPDRFVYRFASIQKYPRLSLIVSTAKLRSDQVAEFGTLVFGLTTDLDDDEWESVYTDVSGIDVVEGRTGVRQVREIRPMRRIISLAYTGQIDRGMARSKTHNMLHTLAGGERPVVWIDDDSILDVSNNAHHDPILAHVLGDLQQSRKAYSEETYAGTTWIRSVLDVSGIRLEEVI